MTTLVETAFFVGGALSIALGEPDSSTAVWAVSARAKVGASFVSVGAFNTTPPATSGRAGGRVVGIATLPGVSEWEITATTTASLPSATLALSASPTTGEISLSAPLTALEGLCQRR